MTFLHITWLEERPDWVVLTFPKNDTFSTYVKKFNAYYYWNRELRRYEVHISVLPNVVRTGKKYFSRVDYSSLPERLQIELVSALSEPDSGQEFWKKNNHSRRIYEAAKTVKNEGPFSVLFLAEDAPSFLVKSVYRTLSLKHHPDQGGDEEEFKKINAAYDEIKKIRKDL